MLKFHSKFSRFAKVSCEWEIDETIFKCGEKPTLKTFKTIVPGMDGVQWWLEATLPSLVPSVKKRSAFSMFLNVSTEIDTYASFSFALKESDHKRTAKWNVFNKKSESLGWKEFISQEELLKNPEKYFKDGKFTIVFEGELNRHGAFETLEVTNDDE